MCGCVYARFFLFKNFLSSLFVHPYYYFFSWPWPKCLLLTCPTNFWSQNKAIHADFSRVFGFSRKILKCCIHAYNQKKSICVYLCWRKWIRELKYYVSVTKATVPGSFEENSAGGCIHTCNGRQYVICVRVRASLYTNGVSAHHPFPHHATRTYTLSWLISWKESDGLKVRRKTGKIREE